MVYVSYMDLCQKYLIRNQGEKCLRINNAIRLMSTWRRENPTSLKMTKDNLVSAHYMECYYIDRDRPDKSDRLRNLLSIMYEWRLQN